MTDKTYDDGVRDGEIEALKEIVRGHKDRLDGHEGRLRILERIIWMLAGAWALLTFLPRIIDMI